jgi:hypothetical protein
MYTYTNGMLEEEEELGADDNPCWGVGPLERQQDQYARRLQHRLTAIVSRTEVEEEEEEGQWRDRRRARGLSPPPSPAPSPLPPTLPHQHHHHHRLLVNSTSPWPRPRPHHFIAVHQTSSSYRWNPPLPPSSSPFSIAGSGPLSLQQWLGGRSLVVQQQLWEEQRQRRRRLLFYPDLLRDTLRFVRLQDLLRGPLCWTSQRLHRLCAELPALRRAQAEGGRGARRMRHLRLNRQGISVWKPPPTASTSTGSGVKENAKHNCCFCSCLEL